MSKKNKMWKRSLNHSLAYVFFLQFSFMQGVFASSSTNESGETQNSQRSLTYDMLRSATHTAAYNVEIAGPYSHEVKKQYQNLVGFPISIANTEYSKTSVMWSKDIQLGFEVEEKSQIKAANPLLAYDKKSESEFIRSLYKFFADKQMDQVIQSQVQATNKKYEAYDKSGKIKDYLKGKALTIKEATIRFPKDTALFFVAIGAVMYNQLYFHYEGNPIAMEQHVASLTDPIANLSFYSFIVANSLSNEAFNRTGYKKLDLEKRVKAFKLLNYKSLFWGMLASNIVADVGHTINACVDGISGIEKSSGDESLITTCGEAMRMWTAPKIVNRYTPLIASLMISQKISEELMRGVSHLKSLSSRIGVLFEGLSFALRSGPAGKIYVVGASLVTTIVTFAIFVQIDHIVQPIINTIYSVVAYPFRRFDNAFNLSFCSKYFKNNNQVPAAFLKDKNEIQSECEDDFVHKILDWRDFSNEWRNAMNGKFEMGYMMWTDMMTTLFNQYAAAEAYYLTFIQEVEEDIENRKSENPSLITNRNHFTRVHYLNGVLVKPSYISTEDKRSLSELSPEERNKLKEIVVHDQLTKPGVLDFGKLNDEGQIMNNGRIGLVKEAIDRQGLFPDTYILKKSKYNNRKVKDIGYCRNHYVNCGSGVYHNNTTVEANQTVLELLGQIKKELDSENLHNMGMGLYKLNTLLKSIDNQDILHSKLTEFRNYLGSPQPIFSATASFPYLYSQSSSNRESLINSNFSYPSKYGDKFENAAYYFTHEMICGPEIAEIKHTLGFKPSFIPPNILKRSLNKNTKGYSVFCGNSTGASPTVSERIVRKNETSKSYGSGQYRENFNKSFDLFGAGKVAGPVGIILQNLESKLLTQVSNEKSENEERPGTVLYFIKWWHENAFKPFELFLDQQNIEYQKLYEHLRANLTNQVHISSGFDLVDTFQYPFKLIGKYWTDAGYSVIDSLKLELDLYLKVIESIARDQDAVDMLMATRKRYDQVFGFLQRVHGFSNINKSKAEQKKSINETLTTLEKNKLGLALSFLNNEGKDGISIKDEKTYQAVAMGLESIDANLRKYLMAYALLEYDSSEKAKQIFDNYKSLDKNKQTHKNGSTGR